MKIRAIAKTKDGYKVFFQNGKVLNIISKDEYQGYSFWGNYFGINDLDIEEDEILGGKTINYSDLPSNIKTHLEYIIKGKKG